MKRLVLLILLLIGIGECIGQTAEELIENGLQYSWPRDSKKYFDPVIKQGNTLAMTFYSMQHFLWYFDSPYYKTSKGYPSKTIKLLNKANVQNEFWVTPMYGFCYEQGVGVKMDLETAAKYFQKTLENKESFFSEIHPSFTDKITDAKFKMMLFSQIHLAFLYENGFGINQNKKEAERLRNQVIEEIKKFRCNNDISKSMKYVQDSVINFLTYMRYGAAKAFCISLYSSNHDRNYRTCADNEEKIWKNLSSDIYTIIADNTTDCDKIIEVARTLSRNGEKEKSFLYYQKAAALHSERAYFNLALCYKFGDGTDKNYKEALKWYWMDDPEHKSYPILESIGEIYKAGGYGVIQNYDSAFWYYDGAIYNMQKSNITVDAELQKKYNELKSKCSDVARYSYLSSKSVDELRTEARTAYSNNRYSYAAELYEYAATRTGKAVDQYNAALSYEMCKNYHQSYYWYEKAANQGYADAQKELPRALYNHAWSYHNSRDYSNAMSYYLKAWNKGYADAANNIGVMYENGEGVSANNYTALSWYEKAKNAGDSHGSSNYYNLKQRMEAPQQTTTSSSSSTSSSGGNVFLDLLDATVQTINVVNDIKNGGSSTSSSSSNTGSYSSSGSYNSGSYSSSGSSNTGGSTTTSGNSSSTSTHIPSIAFCTEKVRLYQRYENRLLLMQREPDVHYNDTDRRNIQKDMRRIRNELISSGCNKNPYKSKMEDWDGTL